MMFGSCELELRLARCYRAFIRGLTFYLKMSREDTFRAEVPVPTLFRILLDFRLLPILLAAPSHHPRPTRGRSTFASSRDTYQKISKHQEALVTAPTY